MTRPAPTSPQPDEPTLPPELANPVFDDGGTGADYPGDQDG